MAATLLEGYRILEVGDLSGAFCGKLLGDLGCEVLQVEPPDGALRRSLGPLVTWNGEQVSSTWLAYSTSKRSICIDIQQHRGRQLLDRLLDRADAIIASGPPAWLEEHRLRPQDVRAGRPRLVAAAITPFGLEGPYRQYRISDLVAQSAGGLTYTNGDRDRPPVRITEEQTWPQAGAQAAFVVIAALSAAQREGVGESIDFSIQEAIVSSLVSVAPWWQLEHRIVERNALTQMGRDILIRNIWPCKDGFVTYRLSVGQGIGSRNLRLIEWMEEEGMAEDLLAVPWEYMSTLEVTQEQVSGWQATIERFFATKTKDELYAEALKRRILLFPVLELSDMLHNEQLRARGFFVPLTDADGQHVQFPGSMFRSSLGAGSEPDPPPLLGQHTRQALTELAGCEEAELAELAAAGVIA